jgi:hypothetical protein
LEGERQAWVQHSCPNPGHQRNENPSYGARINIEEDLETKAQSSQRPALSQINRSFSVCPERISYGINWRIHTIQMAHLRSFTAQVSRCLLASFGGSHRYVPKTPTDAPTMIAAGATVKVVGKRSTPDMIAEEPLTAWKYSGMSAAGQLGMSITIVQQLYHFLRQTHSIEHLSQRRRVSVVLVVEEMYLCLHHRMRP